MRGFFKIYGCFRKIQCSRGISGKHSGEIGFQENTVESRIFRKIIVESRGFRKAQWSARVSGKHSVVTRFQESTVESRIFRKV